MRARGKQTNSVTYVTAHTAPTSGTLSGIQPIRLLRGRGTVSLPAPHMYLSVAVFSTPLLQRWQSNRRTRTRILQPRLPPRHTSRCMRRSRSAAPITPIALFAARAYRCWRLKTGRYYTYLHLATFTRGRFVLLARCGATSSHFPSLL